MPVIVAVGSSNPIKLAAARDAVVDLLGEDTVVRPAAVRSTVPDQPWGDDQTRAGAMARAQAAVEAVAAATIGIGIEAGLVEHADSVESMSWVVATGRNQTGQVSGESRTATYQLPGDLADLVRAGHSLGAATDAVFAGHDLSQSVGTIGPLTGGVLDRRSHYRAGIILALIPFRPANAALRWSRARSPLTRPL